MFLARIHFINLGTLRSKKVHKAKDLFKYLLVSVPTRVERFSNQVAVAGSCGAFFTMIQTNLNKIHSIGRFGSISNAESTQLDTQNLKVKDFVCGYNESIVFTEEGDAYLFPNPLQLLPTLKKIIIQGDIGSSHYGVITSDGGKNLRFLTVKRVLHLWR
jgi:hypothetical protein